jgi:hypothetical protein
MKIKLLFFHFMMSCLAVKSQSVSVNTDGSAPNTSAILDIKSSTKGMLIPRTSTASRMAILNPAKGLMLYDTTTSSFWFYNAAAWKEMTTGSTGWNLSGNTGANPATNFIGTTDIQPLRFRVNNLWAGEIHPTSGNLFLGLNAGKANTTASQNTAIGTNALTLQSVTNLITGNTAIGFDALYSNQPIGAFSGIYNTAVGHSSLRSNTTGYYNTAIGYLALFSNTTAISNTAIGTGAAYYNSIGTGITAVGFKALFNNTNGDENTAIGKEALVSNTTANRNTAIGSNALLTQSYDNAGVSWLSGNVAVGYNALYLNQPSTATNGIYNTAVGTYALQVNATGYNNTAAGYGSLVSNTTGYNNTACGVNALFLNTSGSKNVAVGNDALYTGGTNCTATGSRALYSNATVNNTANGFEALFKTTTGYDNAALGYQALYNNVDGAFNTAVGYAADVALPGLNNATAIGFSAVVNASNKMQLGNVITAAIATSGGYTIASDGRFKENLKDDVKGLDFIMKLIPLTYNFNYNRYDQFVKPVDDLSANETIAQNADPIFQQKEAAEKLIYQRQLDAKSVKRETGFVAQDVERAVKESGYTGFNGVYAPTNPKDNYSLDYSKMVVPLVKAVQEQQAIIEEQNKKFEQQQLQINTLLKEIQRLKDKQQ